MEPYELVGDRVCPDIALKVDVVPWPLQGVIKFKLIYGRINISFSRLSLSSSTCPQVVRVQRGAQPQWDLGLVWKMNGIFLWLEVADVLWKIVLFNLKNKFWVILGNYSGWFWEITLSDFEKIVSVILRNNSEEKILIDVWLTEHFDLPGIL